MELDGGEVVTVRAGDVVIQRGTNHVWHNRSDAACRFAWILLDATPVEINGQRLGDELAPRTRTRRDDMRIIDLSHTIETLPDDMPAFMRVDVTYTDHAAGAIELQQAFGVPPRLLRNEEGPAGERLSIGTHAATHVDAPWHYNSTIQGAPAATIDELPVERFFGPGVVVDARHKADGDAVTAGGDAGRHRRRRS